MKIRIQHVHLLSIRYRISLLGIAIFLACSSPTSAQEISPLLVGNNAWFTNPTDEVWALTGECGVKTIRIGGNAFNDNLPSNATLLGWVKKIRAIGAEPIIQVSQHQSAAAAASVVRYMNVEMGGEIAPVKYWNIGNEPWLEAGRPATSTIGPMVEAYFKPIAAAMKEVDPTIKIFGFDEAYYMEDAINALFGGANDIAGKVPGKDYYYCDGISWHRYPQDDNINLAIQGVEDFKASIIKCKQKVDEVNASHNRAGDNALQWGIGEYNAKNGPVVHTWENGQMFGGILGLCMKYGATYAATWSMFENGGSRTGSDYSFIDGANMTPRSSYRHMEFVAKHFTGQYLDGKTTSSHIMIYGAQNGGRTSVMIMNRNSGEPLKYTLHLNKDATYGDHVVLNVAGDSQLSYSDIIGERTTHVLIFQGDSIVRINYSSNHFENELPPVETTLVEATTLPDSPSGLEGTSPGFDRIVLSWVDNSENESGFIVEQKTNGAFQVVGLVDANTTTFTHVGLSAATSYEYRILAYNSLGESPYSNSAIATTAAAPQQVTFKGPHVIPGKLEVEDFNEGGQSISYFDLEVENRGGQYRTNHWVDIEATTDEGGGFNIGYVTDGEWINYNIDEVTGGDYTLAIRLASNSTTADQKKIGVWLDEELLGSFTPVVTGGWQNWNTYYLNNLTLEDGSDQVLKLAFQGSGYNINWLEFVNNGVLSGSLPDDISRLKAFYNSSTHSIHLQLMEEARSVSVRLYDLSGKVYLDTERQNFKSGDFKACSFPNGIYLLCVQSDQEYLSQKLFLDN